MSIIFIYFSFNDLAGSAPEALEPESESSKAGASVAVTHMLGLQCMMATVH